MDIHQISLEQTNPLDVGGDALLHPTTGAEAPDGERLDDFYERVGESVLNELQSAQPIRIGESTSTDGGNSHFQRIVHLPIQTAPDVPTTPDNIQTALRTGIVGLDEEETTNAVVPAPLPPDSSDLDLEELADTLARDLLQYPPAHLSSLTLADESSEWIQQLKTALGNQR